MLFTILIACSDITLVTPEKEADEPCESLVGTPTPTRMASAAARR